MSHCTPEYVLQSIKGQENLQCNSYCRGPILCARLLPIFHRSLLVSSEELFSMLQWRCFERDDIDSEHCLYFKVRRFSDRYSAYIGLR